MRKALCAAEERSIRLENEKNQLSETMNSQQTQANAEKLKLQGQLDTAYTDKSELEGQLTSSQVLLPFQFPVLACPPLTLRSVL